MLEIVRTTLTAPSLATRGNASSIATSLHGASAKTTPVDADELGLLDSAASYVLKRITFANIKAGIFSGFGALLAVATAKATPVDADGVVIHDSAASQATKRLRWQDLKATLKTYFDTLYQPLNAVLTATTASFTTTLLSKLNGIEASADVTDAGNVGSSINGATGKGTPVDADQVALIDSEASNVLKKLSWFNIKNALEAIFAKLASPTFTGTPAAPTATAGTNTTQIATTAFVTGAVGTESTARANADTVLGNRLTVVETDTTNLGYLRFPLFSGGGADVLLDAAGILGDGVFLNARGEPFRGRPGIIYRTDGLKALRAVFGYGQSLSSDQVNNGLAASLTTVPPNVDRELMFVGGTRPAGVSASGTPMAQSNITAIVPLVEGDVLGGIFGETSGHGLLTQILGSFEDWEGFLWGTFGLSGQLYELDFVTSGHLGIRKGGVVFRNMERAIKSAFDICQDNDIEFSVEAIAFDHGENDEATPQATYKSYLLEFQADIAGVARAITRQGFDPLILLTQDSSWTESNLTTSVLAQYEVARDYPEKFVFSGPKYQLPYSDSRHLTAPGYRLKGEYHGLAWARKIAGDVVATFPVRATRQADTITVECNVPVLPLVIDTSLVTNPGNYGVGYTQVGGTTRTVSAVSIHADGDKVIVVLSGDPGAPTTESVTFAMNTSGLGAGPTTGARCCIHDSTTTTAIDGTVMHSYMPHAVVPVTIDLGSEA